MKVVTGVDPSSRKLAITTSFGNSTADPEMVTIDLPQDHTKGCGLAFRKFYEYIHGLQERTGHTPFVFMERPLMGFASKNVSATIVQSQIGGSVMAAAEEALVPLELVMHSTWKLNVISVGNASKPAIATWVRDEWPEAYDLACGDQDLLDSACINRYGHQTVNRPKRKIVRKKIKAVV